MRISLPTVKWRGINLTMIINWFYYSISFSFYSSIKTGYKSGWNWLRIDSGLNQILSWCEASAISLSLNHYQTARQFSVYWTEFSGGLFWSADNPYKVKTNRRYEKDILIHEDIIPRHSKAGALRCIIFKWLSFNKGTIYWGT